MDLFNKTFFRFAFGFLAIILVSVGLIIMTNAFGNERGVTAGMPCLFACDGK